MIDRRETLKRLASVAAALGAGGLAACGDDAGRAPAAGARGPAGPQGPLGPLGLQLYTLRAAVQRDMDATLVDVAELGYREVEFAGYFGSSPRQVRNALGAAGLSAPSALVSVDDVIEAWFPMLQAAVEIGHRWLVVGWLPEEMRETLDAWRLTAELFNRAGDEAAVAGIRLAYHNRDFDFVPLEGRLPIDVLLEETDPSLVDLELDVYWTLRGGGDPLELFGRWPGRVPLIHLNDMASDGRMTDVGAGVVDWQAILARRFTAGIQHIYVDREEAEEPWEAAAASLAWLAALDV